VKKADFCCHRVYALPFRTTNNRVDPNPAVSLAKTPLPSADQSKVLSPAHPSR
jgi:hypothetical protein